MSEPAVRAVDAPPQDRPKGATLADLISAYEAASGRASENVRFLAAAGIALVWVMAGKNVGNLTPDLLWDGVFLAGALFADFLHYVVQAWILRSRHRMAIRAGKKRGDEVGGLSKREDHVLTAMWWTKIIVLVVAYVLVGGSVVSRIVGATNAPAGTQAEASIQQASDVCR